MLAFGSAIVCKPELLLVDELSLGLAPVVVEDLARRLASIRQELGITVLLVEQNAGVALGIADYGYVLENGRVVLEGAAAELRGRREIQQSYLGQASGEERRSYRALRPRTERSIRMAELAVEHLSLQFGGLAVLTDVSLHVEAGELLGADRSERRRQDQRAQLHQRHLSRPAARSGCAARTSTAGPRTRSRGSASHAPSSTAKCFRR